MSVKRTRIARALVTVLALGAMSCGSGDGDGAPDAASSAAPDTARACLEEAGFEVGGETSVSEELADATGLEAQLVLGNETGGAGSVAYYADEAAATEASEAASASGPAQVAGRMDTTVYNFADATGDPKQAGEAIQKCLG